MQRRCIAVRTGSWTAVCPDGRDSWISLTAAGLMIVSCGCDREDEGTWVPPSLVARSRADREERLEVAAAAVRDAEVRTPRAGLRSKRRATMTMTCDSRRVILSGTKARALAMVNEAKTRAASDASSGSGLR